MLKNYLFSPLYSAPLLCSSPLFLFSYDALLSASVSFLLQPSFSFLQPSFSFFLTCCPFFSPKYFFSPKCFLAQNVFPCLWFSTSFFSSFSVLFFFLTCCPFSSAPLFFCACLLLYSLPTSKAIKISSFGSVYPRPNILSNCFTSLLFE